MSTPSPLPTVVPVTDSSGRVKLSDGDSECEKPQQFKIGDLFDKASDLAQKTGASAECVKHIANLAQQHATSDSTTASMDVEALIASAKAQLTNSYQDSSSSQSQKLDQEGCGTVLVNANNSLQQSAQMQCILNKYSQKSNVATSTSASITIESLPLSAAENASKTAAIAQYEALIATTLSQQDPSYLAYFNIVMANKNLTFTQQQQFLTDFQTRQKNSLDTIRLAYAATLDSFNRDLTMSGTKLKVSATTQMTASFQMTTQAKSDLQNIQNAAATDVAAQTIANSLGVSASEPSVKSAASRAVQSNSSSASSSKTDITAETQINVDNKGNVTIRVPGKINLSNVTIDANAAATVMIQAMMSQSVTSGLAAASSFLSKSDNVQGVVNQVKGLDDMQNALNAGNIGAIKAAGDITVDATKAFWAGSTTTVVAAIMGGLVLLALVFYGPKLMKSAKELKNG